MWRVISNRWLRSPNRRRFPLPFGVRTKPLARRTLRVGKGSGRRLRLAPSWRLCVLARNYRRAGMTENAIAKEIVDAAFRMAWQALPCR